MYFRKLLVYTFEELVKMIKVIFDCDNTMGVPEKDVDDGLTLLYLLGRKDIEVLGVTTTYGNSTIDIVYSNTKLMFEELNLNHIPLLKGGPSPNDRISPAAEYLLKTVMKYPKEVVLLATGSLTNLFGAYQLDKNFFNYVKEIVLMGGIHKPLVINNKNLDELNFSCDPEATHQVLKSGAKITVLTGHICLQALFGHEEYTKLMNNPSSKVYQYIKEKTIPWFEFIMKEFAIDGFYNWDIVAAVFITNPELFNENHIFVNSTPNDLRTGMLMENTSYSNLERYILNIPTEIKNIEKFNETIFEAWKNCESCLSPKE